MPRERKLEPPISGITPDVIPAHPRFLETLNDKLTRLQRQISDLRGLNGPVRLADNLDMTGHTIIGGGPGTAEGKNFLTQEEGDARYLRGTRRAAEPVAVEGTLQPWRCIINDVGSEPGTEPLVTVTDGYPYKPVSSFDGHDVRLYGWYGTLKVPPGASGEVKVDSFVTYDDGATWTSLFPVDDDDNPILPTFTEGEYIITGTAATLAVTLLTRGGFVRHDLVTVDGVACDIYFELFGLEVPD